MGCKKISFISCITTSSSVNPFSMLQSKFRLASLLYYVKSSRALSCIQRQTSSASSCTWLLKVKFSIVMYWTTLKWAQLRHVRSLIEPNFVMCIYYLKYVKSSSACMVLYCTTSRQVQSAQSCTTSNQVQSHMQSCTTSNQVQSAQSCTVHYIKSSLVSVVLYLINSSSVSTVLHNIISSSVSTVLHNIISSSVSTILFHSD